MTTAPLVPAAPVLGHVEGVELVESGLWAASTGPFEATSEKLIHAIGALDCPGVRRPVLKLGHVGGIGSPGDPALGFVANLRVENEGQTLVGDFRGMPAWLTEEAEEGAGSVLSSAYPDRSVECEEDYTCQLGHVHPFVVHAVSLLGVERPAVGTLASLQELYGVVAASTPSSTGTVFELTSKQEAPVKPIAIALGAKIAAAATTDDVRRAYYGGPGSSWSLWIREMYVDPPELIVDDDDAGTIQRVPYSIDSAGVVTFGDPEQVKVTYVAAQAGRPDRAQTWPDRATSREGFPLAAPAAPPIPVVDPSTGQPETGEELAVDLNATQLARLRETLGLEADADEAAITAALDADAPTTETAPVAEPIAASTPKLPEGVTVIDSATLANLQSSAEAGQQAATRLADQDRDRLLDAALQAGKFPPSRREHYAAAYKADPEGTTALLEALHPGMVPVELRGDAGNPEASSDDALLAELFPGEGYDAKVGG